MPRKYLLNKICEQCGKPFETKHLHQETCTIKCGTTLMRKREREARNKRDGITQEERNVIRFEANRKQKALYRASAQGQKTAKAQQLRYRPKARAIDAFRRRTDISYVLRNRVCCLMNSSLKGRTKDGQMWQTLLGILLMISENTSNGNLSTV